MQAVCAEHDAELFDDAIVAHGAQSAIGHDFGLGRGRRGRAGGGRHLAARPRVALLGGHDAHVRGRRRRAAGRARAVLARCAGSRSDAVLPMVRAGADCREIYARSCEPFEAAGQADAAHQGPGRAAGPRLLPRPRPRRRPRGPRAPDARPQPGHAAAPATSSRSSRAATGRGFGGCRLEDLAVVTERRLRGAHRLPVRPLSARCGEGRASLPGATAAVASLRPMTGAALDLPLLTRGKVREMYDLGDDLLMVASDRISTYDAVHPTPIPDKGRVLTGLSVLWFGLTGEIVANHLVSATDGVPADVRGRALRVRRLEMLPVECVVRGYLSGSGWKDYQATGARVGHRAAGRAAGVRPAARADLHALDEGRDGPRRADRPRAHRRAGRRPGARRAPARRLARRLLGAWPRTRASAG